MWDSREKHASFLRVETPMRLLRGRKPWEKAGHPLPHQGKWPVYTYRPSFFKKQKTKTIKKLTGNLNILQILSTRSFILGSGFCSFSTEQMYELSVFLSNFDVMI